MHYKEVLLADGQTAVVSEDQNNTGGRVRVILPTCRMNEKGSWTNIALVVPRLVYVVDELG